MKVILNTLVALFLVLFCGVTFSVAADYEHEIKDKKITFAWKVDGDKLAVKLSAETEGWVGIGFNPVAEMKGANFILGYVKDGETKIVDEYGDSETSHASVEKAGGKPAVTTVGGTRANGVTSIEFTIPLKAQDKGHTDINVNGDTVILLAYGPRDSFKMKHSYRTELKVNLSTGATK